MMPNVYQSTSCDLIRFNGRTYFDEDLQGTYFNWTGSGFICCCTGTYLEAEFYGQNGDLNKEETPYLGVIIDDDDRSMARFEIKEGSQWIRIAAFTSDPGKSHKVSVIKLSENMRGKAALLRVKTDGELLPLQTDDSRLSIEFIGDSITCGYGNEAANASSPFVPKEENGYMGFAMQTARMMQARASLVCVSGITTAIDRSKKSPMKMLSMDELYPFTDRLLEEHQGKTTYMKWDFEHHGQDIIVIDLGTNDVNALKSEAVPFPFPDQKSSEIPQKRTQKQVNEDVAAARDFFISNYIRFLKTVRNSNRTARIICCLGPLDYYLYPEMLFAINQYKIETNDNRVFPFRFLPVVQWTEGFGADGHPSLKTHARMAAELAEFIRNLLDEEQEMG